MMTFSGQGRVLESLDISYIGHSIGVGEDHLHAVMEVETLGGGFFADGSIKMLPEPHVFYRELGEGPKRDRAVREGLAYKRWGSKPYPKSSGERYRRLKAMMDIDLDAALRSCSWGLGQIMGFNCKLAGYPTAEAMVRDFTDDEDRHLQAMVNFIVSAGLDDDLRRQDWSGFARGYNGSAYRKNGYHTKLARAFARWQTIPDTPFEIDRREVDPNPEAVPASHMGDRPTLYLGMRHSVLVADYQTILSGMGYHLGKIDGHMGTTTKAATMAFQSNMGLHPTDGVVGTDTWAALYEAVSSGHTSPVSQARKEATVADVRAEGSATIKEADDAQAGAGAGLTALVGGASVDAVLSKGGDTLSKAEELKSSAERVLGEGFLSGAIDWASDHWYLIVGGLVLVYIMAKAQRQKENRVAEYRSAANLGK